MDNITNDKVPRSILSPVQPPNNIINPPLIHWYPRVLVIGPGGVKGFKVLGFLSPLEDTGFLEHIDTYCGVSIGSIICLLMIAGYQIREIVGEAATIDIFKEVGDFNLQSVMSNRGLMSNEPVRKRLTQLMLNKFGVVPTLHGLYMQTGKAFISVTLNATDEECVMMGPFTHPNVSCVDATMFSMNIPFVFYQLVYHGKTYVDGALGNPYPVDYFDDGKTNILGIYMKNTSKNQTPQHNGSIIQRIDDSKSLLPLSIYSSKIIHSLMDQMRIHILQKTSEHCRHVCLETENFTNTIGYGMTTDLKAHMLVDGFNQGKEFITQLQDGKYTPPKNPHKSIYEFPPYYTIRQNQTSSQSDDIINQMNA